MKVVQPVNLSEFQVTGPFAATGPNPPWSPSHPHMGLDLWKVNCRGIEARAMVGGEVVSFTNDGSFGTGVCIKFKLEGENRFLLYAHLLEAKVRIGDKVVAGDIVGRIGNTSTDPIDDHLHLQLCRYSTFVRSLADNWDPMILFNHATEEDDPVKIAELEDELKEHRRIIAMLMRVLCANTAGERGDPLAKLEAMDEANFDLQDYADNLNTSLREVRVHVGLPLND